MTGDLAALIAVLATLMGCPAPCWGCGCPEVRAEGLCGPCHALWVDAFTRVRDLGAPVDEAARYAGMRLAREAAA